MKASNEKDENYLSGRRSSPDLKLSDEEAFRKILVALDLSEKPRTVLKQASCLAREFGSDVIVCTVIMLNTSVVGNDSDGYPANGKELEMKKTLTDLVIKEFGLTEREIETKILHGEPAMRIVEYAEYSNCNLIVVGSRKGGLKKFFTGSVSRSVVKKSKKPIFVVKY